MTATFFKTTCIMPLAISTWLSGKQKNNEKFLQPECTLFNRVHHCSHSLQFSLQVIWLFFGTYLKPCRGASASQSDLNQRPNTTPVREKVMHVFLLSFSLLHCFSLLSYFSHISLRARYSHQPHHYGGIKARYFYRVDPKKFWVCINYKV